MVIALDIGNSTIKIGVFISKAKENYTPENEFSIITDKNKTSDEYGALIRFLFLHHQIEYSGIQGFICSSVVPSLNETISVMAEKYFNCSSLFVSSDMNTGLTFDYPKPGEIGADRIISAVAAKEIYGSPCIIVSFGTATTFSVLSPQSKYLGGVIAPGFQSGLESLSSKTSLLPHIDFIKPESVVGKTTVSAMNSGVYFGAIGMLEGIVKRLKAELDLDNAKVIAMGGYSQLIEPATSVIDVCDPSLTLKGLKILYHKNKID